MRPKGRVPPYSNEAELAVLGAVLLNNEALREVRAVCRPEHLYNEVNRRLLVAMIELVDTGTPVDHVTLGQHLVQKGDLEKIGGSVALANLTDAVATVANVGHYAKIVVELAARRGMIYAAQEIVARGFGDVEDTEEYLATSRSSIATAANYLASKSSGPRLIDDDVVQVHKEISYGKPPEGVIATGLRGLDWVGGGLWPGFLHVLASATSMGKSVVLVNVANNVSQRGEKVLYITLEDTRKMTVYRMFARYANIDLTDLTLGRVKEFDEFQRLTEAMTILSGKKPLWIDDTAGLTSEAIAQVAAHHQATHGLDLLIIDHLHEVVDKGESETVITSHAARNFRDIAKDLNVPVLLACQLNRELMRRPNKRPILSDLRQSGTIEQAARFVWFLHREGYYTKDDKDHSMEWIIAKASHGRLATLKMYAHLSRMYVRDWDVPTDGLWPRDEPDGDPVPDHKKPPRPEAEPGDSPYGGHDSY